MKMGRRTNNGVLTQKTSIKRVTHTGTHAPTNLSTHLLDPPHTHPEKKREACEFDKPKIRHTSRAAVYQTFSGRPGPSSAMLLSQGTRGMDESPSHITGEQSAVMARFRSSTQLAMGPATT